MRASCRRYDDGDKRHYLWKGSRAKEYRWPPEARKGKLLLFLFLNIYLYILHIYFNIYI